MADADTDVDEGTEAETTSAESAQSKSAARRQRINDLIREHGSANQALYVVDRDAKELRQKYAALRGEEVDGLVMLKGDEARKYQQFLALKLAPEVITQALAERDTLKSENTTLHQRVTDAERQRSRDEAATLAGYKPAVLAALEKAQGFRTEVRDQKNDKGEAVRVPYAVVGEGEKAEAKPLAEFASSTLADFLPALASGAAATPSAGSPYPATPPKATGPGSKPGDVAARHMAQTYVTPSQRQREQQKQPAQ